MEITTFRNWFIASRNCDVPLKIGAELRTGSDMNKTRGTYVVVDIQQVDDDTAHIVVKRLKVD